MTELYYRIATKLADDALMDEQCLYLGLPRYHCLNNEERPDLALDQCMGEPLIHPDPLILEVLRVVNTSELPYNSHTSNPIDPFWKAGLFNGLLYYTKQEAINAGYFSSED